MSLLQRATARKGQSPPMLTHSQGRGTARKVMHADIINTNRLTLDGTFCCGGKMGCKQMRGPSDAATMSNAIQLIPAKPISLHCHNHKHKFSW